MDHNYIKVYDRVWNFFDYKLVEIEIFKVAFFCYFGIKNLYLNAWIR